MICTQCAKDFPSDLLQDLEQGAFDENGLLSVRVRKMCPICALKICNEEHGFPANTPFHGPKARNLYDTAVRHLERTLQNEDRA